MAQTPRRGLISWALSDRCSTAARGWRANIALRVAPARNERCASCSSTLNTAGCSPSRCANSTPPVPGCVMRGSKMPNLNIAVAGNQWITRYLIEALTEQGSAPRLLLNMGPEWADRISGYENLEATANKIGASLCRPLSYGLTSDADKAELSGRNLDVLFVFGWQRLIPEWLIRACKIGAFGVHGGPKPPPRCRGRAVFNWAILLGCDKFHMYAFRLTPGIDDGDIVGQATFDILPADDILTVYHKNCIVTS